MSVSLCPQGNNKDVLPVDVCVLQARLQGTARSVQLFLKQFLKFIPTFTLKWGCRQNPKYKVLLCLQTQLILIFSLLLIYNCVLVFFYCTVRPQYPCEALNFLWNSSTGIDNVLWICKVTTRKKSQIRTHLKEINLITDGVCVSFQQQTRYYLLILF